VLTVLAMSLWAFAGYQVMTATMIGINRHRSLIPIFIGEAFLNLVMSVILAPHFGIVGVAWGTALPRLVVSLFVGPLYARHRLGVLLRPYYVQVLIRPAIGMIPFALATQATEMWWPAANVLGFFGQVLAAVPVAALGAWFVVLTSRERQVLASALALPSFVRDGVS
jgi:O-antigen/teichoic acid export membrane protein